MSLQKRGVWGAAPARGYGGANRPHLKKFISAFHLIKIRPIKETPDIFWQPSSSCLCCKWYILRLLLKFTLSRNVYFFRYMHLLQLKRSGKNVSVTNKMWMFTQIISWFVFNLVWWLVNPLGTQCHCSNAMSGAQPQPGGMKGRSSPISKNYNCLHFIKTASIKLTPDMFWRPSASCFDKSWVQYKLWNKWLVLKKFVLLD